jgi:nucleoside-diphosphate-sugar epimerase
VLNEPGKRVLVAGASGAIGRRLCRLLIGDGWTVIGTTRSADKASALSAVGVSPVIVDVFDEERLCAIVAEERPAVVIHQLTDLPPGLDPAKMAEAIVRNARLRAIGTRNLIAAAIAGGARRMVAQSIAFAYAPGPMPYREEAPLNVDAPDDAGGLTARAVASLEQQVLSAPFVGIVLRYGRFYGPGTGFDTAPRGGPVHVDAAADAARRAITLGSAGIYNVAEEDGTVSSLKAIKELGWRPAFRVAETKEEESGGDRARPQVN